MRVFYPRFSPSSSRGVAGVNSSSGGIVADSNGVGASSGSPSTASLGRTRSFSDLTERFGDKLRLNENNGDGYEVCRDHGLTVTVKVLSIMTNFDFYHFLISSATICDVGLCVCLAIFLSVYDPF